MQFRKNISHFVLALRQWWINKNQMIVITTDLLALRCAESLSTNNVWVLSCLALIEYNLRIVSDNDLPSFMWACLHVFFTEAEIVGVHLLFIWRVATDETKTGVG